MIIVLFFLFCFSHSFNLLAYGGSANECLVERAFEIEGSVLIPVKGSKTKTCAMVHDAPNEDDQVKAFSKVICNHPAGYVFSQWTVLFNKNLLSGVFDSYELAKNHAQFLFENENCEEVNLDSFSL